MTRTICILITGILLTGCASVPPDETPAHDPWEALNRKTHRFNNAFDRVTLKPGESKAVSLKIPIEDLRYWNEAKQAWDYDVCDLELLVGASAADIKLNKKVSMK